MQVLTWFVLYMFPPLYKRERWSVKEERDIIMGLKNDLVVYTRLECESCEEMTCCIEKAKEEGADLVELCIDDFTFSDISQLEELLKQRSLPSIVSFR